MSTTTELQSYKSIPREKLESLPKFGEGRDDGNPLLQLQLLSSKQSAVFYVIEYDPVTKSFYGYVETPLDSDMNTLTDEVLDVHDTTWDPDFQACRFGELKPYFDQ